MTVLANPRPGTAGRPDEVSFALGQVSVSGSPVFPALLFDDGSAVSLHAVLPLAAQLGLVVTGTDSIFGLTQNWDANFAALRKLVEVLAYDDRARGHRGAFTSAEFLSLHAPLTGSRQIFGQDGEASAPGRFFNKLPTTMIGPREKLMLPEPAAKPFAAIGIGAVFGRPARGETAQTAMSAIAGYMLVNDIADNAAVDVFLARNRPGYLPAGPYLVPARYAPDISAIRPSLLLNGQVVLTGEQPATSLDWPAQIASLTANTLVLPGDILCLGFAASRTAAANRALEDGDIIEAGISGLGQQMTNCMRG